LNTYDNLKKGLDHLAAAHPTRLIATDHAQGHDASTLLSRQEVMLETVHAYLEAKPLPSGQQALNLGQELANLKVVGRPMDLHVLYSVVSWSMEV
jgi:hypothetical protein